MRRYYLDGLKPDGKEMIEVFTENLAEGKWIFNETKNREKEVLSFLERYMCLIVK